MPKREYTIKMHRYRCRAMLRSKNYIPHGACPASPRFGSVMKNEILWSAEPCPTCRQCAQVSWGCPCNRLGETEAKRRLELCAE